MFSVVIPTCNRLGNLAVTLQAIQNQSLSSGEFEVIVSDDASIDGTEDVIADGMVDGRFPKFKYIRAFKKELWNASRPRNFGAKVAERDSEFFVFLDSDVVLNPDALGHYLDDYRRNPDRVVIGPYDWLPPQRVAPLDVTVRWDQLINGTLPRPESIRGGLGDIGPDMRKASFNKAKSPDDLFGELFDGLACFGGNLMVPKRIFWKAGGYDENIFCGCEDGDFGLTLWEMGVKFSYDVRTQGYHVWHERSAYRAQNIKPEVDKLNLKHFGTSDQKLIDYTREAFRRWGNPSWQPPPEWITDEGEER